MLQQQRRARPASLPGPNNNQPHLTKCDNLTGQLWTLAKTDKVEAATNTVPLAYPTASFKEPTAKPF
jgi:hypothetical protein